MVTADMKGPKRAIPIRDATPIAERSIKRNPGAQQASCCLIQFLGTAYGVFDPLRIDRNELPDLAVSVVKPGVNSLQFEYRCWRFVQGIVLLQKRTYNVEYVTSR
jgi:hypothetical protein